MITRAAILCLLLSACTAPRVTVDARPQQDASVVSWQRLMTERLNAVVACLSSAQQACIDEKEKEGAQ